MAASPERSAIKELYHALTLKERVLSGIGIVLLLLGVLSGQTVILIAVILISVGLLGYAYVSLASRLSTTGLPHNRYVNKSVGEETGKVNREGFENGADVNSVHDSEQRNGREPRLTEAHISEFFDFESEMYPSSEPRSEFDFLLGKVLSALKESLIAHTVAFFWVNFDKQELVFQGRASDSHNLRTERKIPLNNDIVSQIARKGKPQFISHISPNSESDLLPYYQDVDFVKSFIGVPVYYHSPTAEKSVIGVLAIDSKAEDAFGSETLALLSQFTKLLSALIKSHTEKYDLLVDSELLLSIRRMHEKMRENLDLRTIVHTLAEQTKRIVGYDFLAVTMFNDDTREWVVYYVDIAHGGAYVSPHQVVRVDRSLVGSVLDSNRYMIVDDLTTVAIPRFGEEEKIDSQGSIVIVPVSSFKKCYGTISLERRERFAYSARDIEVLYRLVDNAASALEILYMSELVDKYVIIDDATALLKRSYFEQRLRDEIRRADDFGNDLTYVMFSIDNIQQLVDRYGKEGVDTAIYAFSKFLKSAVRQYDIVGRIDYNKFGVILVNTPSNEGYLWAEKLRKNFAGQVLQLNDKTTSITISSGVCGLSEDMQYVEFVKHATVALQKAIENGGNLVRVY